MEFNLDSLLAVSVALGVGLLIGAERERRKGIGADRAAAGIRTFAVSALAGVVAMLLGDILLIAVVAIIVSGFAMLAYYRASTKDPGITSEIALALTCLIGGLAAYEPLLAGAIGVVLAALLAGREYIHQFVRSVLSERELHDAILFAAIAMIVLPLAPNRFLGPFHALNPHTLVTIVLLVMAVSALGYAALRIVGARLGLPLAGFLSGFISSTATIYSMGKRTRESPALRPGLVAGAVLSSLATIVQLAIVVLMISPALLVTLVPSLLLAGAAAALYAMWFTLVAFRQPNTPHQQTGRAFDLKTALSFAALIAIVTLMTAALNVWAGDRGVLVVSFISGLADAHAGAIAAASLFSAGNITDNTAQYAVLLGLSANTIVKSVVAYTAGGNHYTARIVPGLILMTSMAWVGALLL